MRSIRFAIRLRNGAPTRVLQRLRAHDQAFVVAVIQRCIQIERIVALLEGAPGVAHDAGVGTGLQAAQQFADILGMRQVLVVETAEGAPIGVSRASTAAGRSPVILLRSSVFTLEISKRAVQKVRKLRAAPDSGRISTRVSSRICAMMRCSSERASAAGWPAWGSCRSPPPVAAARVDSACRPSTASSATPIKRVERFVRPEAAGIQADAGVEIGGHEGRSV
jgi:hypothetical protein